MTVDDPAEKPRRVVDVIDVASGLIAYVEEDERGSTLRVGETLDGSARAMPSGWHGVLSPDGRYVGVEDPDVLAVYDTTTAEDVTPDLDGYPFKVVYGWTDEDTAMVFALTSIESEPFVADFLSCDIPAGDCTVLAAGIEVAQGRLTLPVGDPMDS